MLEGKMNMDNELNSVEDIDALLDSEFNIDEDDDAQDAADTGAPEEDNSDEGQDGNDVDNDDTDTSDQDEDGDGTPNATDAGGEQKKFTTDEKKEFAFSKIRQENSQLKQENQKLLNILLMILLYVFSLITLYSINLNITLHH
jgi:hypothetical protein